MSTFWPNVGLTGAHQNRKGIWVALKILRADQSDNCQELCVLKALKEQAPEGLNTYNIVELLDDFRLEGPNGTHQCYVLEFLGPALGYLIKNLEKNDGREPEDCLPILEQVFKALTFIHQTGFTHGGTQASLLRENTYTLQISALITLPTPCPSFLI